MNLVKSGATIAQAAELAGTQVTRKMRAAEQAVEPSGRLQEASWALRLAFASESLELSMTTVKWIRRFLRDPLVFPKLISLISNEDVVLSGIASTGIATSVASIRKDTRDAGQILMDLIDIIIASLREPAYSTGDWRHIWSLLSRATIRRIKMCHEIQQRLDLDDDECFELLWKEHVEVLMEIERKAVAPGHERLRMRDLGGPLESGWSREFTVANAPPAVYRFFDDLARARDAFWKDFRPTIFPAAGVLPKPFPTGLPVQSLTSGFHLDTPDLHLYAPYITSRIEAALFLAKDVALIPVPDDEELREAIGGHIDSYRSALSMYTSKSLGLGEISRRMQKVWSHAINVSNQTRMTTKEAEFYWSGLALPPWPNDYVLLSDLLDWPIFPDFVDIHHIEEWDPRLPSYYHFNVACIKPLTYIDLSKSFTGSFWLEFRFVRPTLAQESVDRRLHDVWSWSLQQAAKKNTKIREGRILSALLYLEGHFGSKDRLFATCFPERSHNTLLRYGAAYLDGALLSDRPTGSSPAIEALRVHLSKVPPVLLYRLAKNILYTLNSSDSSSSTYSEIESTYFTMLKMLASSDRPELATELISDAVFARPDASSWHRQLLTASYLNRLSAKAVLSFAQSWTETINRNFNRQPENQSLDAKPQELMAEAREEDKSQPRVKVTTFKMLAQLLNDSKVFPRGLILEILSNLLVIATHVDIRRAAVETLLSLYEAASPERAKHILKALETAVPIAGNILERRTVSEQQWQEAEKSKSAPEIPVTADSTTDAPLLSALIAFAQRLNHQAYLEKKLLAFLEMILFPVIRSLSSQMHRWVSIFLHAHCPNEADDLGRSIPALPVYIDLYRKIMDACSTRLPSDLFEAATTYISFTIAPPRSVEELNNQLHQTSDGKDKHNILAWLNKYSATSSVSKKANRRYLILLDRDDHPDGGLQCAQIRDAYLRIYEKVLTHGDNTLEIHKSFVYHLWCHLRSSNTGPHRLKPLVEQMLSRLEALRTEDWQKDPDRLPKVLPNVLDYKLWLILCDTWSTTDGCLKLADKLIIVMQEISGVAWPSRFESVKHKMAYLNGLDRLRVADHLGAHVKDLSGTLDDVDVMRAELAAHVIKSTESKDMKLQTRSAVIQMLRTWERCVFESIRLLAYDDKIQAIVAKWEEM